MNVKCTANDQLSWQETAELLAEVLLETEAGPEINLHSFAAVLQDLIHLRQNQAAGDNDETNALSEFIAQGLDEVRAVMNADRPSFSQIDALSERAIERWGEQLVAIRDNKHSSPNQDWADTADRYCEPVDDEAEVPDAPSAEAIRALLSQFAKGGVEDIASSNDTCQSAEGPPIATRQAIDMATFIELDSISIADINELDPELREAFLADAICCVSSMESALLRLESAPQDAEPLHQILRELHTLKGASGSVGLTDLADQLHQLEDTLREDQSAGRAPSIENLLTNIDQIRSQIIGTRSTTTHEVASRSADQSSVENPARATATAADLDDVTDDEMVRVNSSQLNRLMDMLVELVMLRNQRASELAELQDIYHELINSVSKMRLLSNESDMRADSCSSLQLSEVANDVLETAQHLRDCTRPFTDGNAAVSRFIRQFRQELVQLRRTPISGLFRRLQRVVRDAARSEFKQVRLTMLGEDAGMERALQQRLYEPLLHIVRNSVCHGIEIREDRVKCGKAPEGVISLEAKSGPDLFVIEVCDDGRGLDYPAIRRRGVERGLLAADQAVSRDELSQLIFHPGFSTRESASQIGGRGVGMDVVAATMQRMRGWLQISSEPGAGTRIRLSFPLPSVIQHAMVFRAAEQLFAFPMESVQAAGKVHADVPQASFSRLLGLAKNSTCESQHAIVVANDRSVADIGHSPKLALFVDEIIGPEELVVRPLPTLLKNHPFCVGATLSGMGQTVILLDARRLLQSQTAPLVNALHRSQPTAEVCSKTLASQRLRVLVVDDSLSARKRVARSLRRYPLDVVEATNGKQALELLKKEDFAVVFSDLEMPNVDGMELLEELRCSGPNEPLPVVIISSRSEKEFTDRARMLGATNYLIKPLTDEALDAVLPSIAALRHLISDAPFTSSEERQ